MVYTQSSARTDSRLVEKTAAISVRDDGGLRLAVIADTHSRPHPNSVQLVKEQEPDAILHAGDIGDLSVLSKFREIAPVHFVRGNIDERGADLPVLLDISLSARERTALNASEAPKPRPLLKILLLHIGVNGPKLRSDAARWAREKSSQLVVCGHSHVPFIGRDRGITIFNPGSVGPRRFTLPIVFGMLELKAGQLHLWHIDCETGARWSPP